MRTTATDLGLKIVEAINIYSFLDNIITVFQTAIIMMAQVYRETESSFIICSFSSF